MTLNIEQNKKCLCGAVEFVGSPVSVEEPAVHSNARCSSLHQEIEKAVAEEREKTAREVVEFIKGKSEKVTNHLWYVADECLEDVPRFFSLPTKEK